MNQNIGDKRNPSHKGGMGYPCILT